MKYLKQGRFSKDVRYAFPLSDALVFQHNNVIGGIIRYCIMHEFIGKLQPHPTAPYSNDDIRVFIASCEEFCFHVNVEHERE